MAYQDSEQRVLLNASLADLNIFLPLFATEQSGARAMLVKCVEKSAKKAATHSNPICFIM